MKIHSLPAICGAGLCLAMLTACGAGPSADAIVGLDGRPSPSAAVPAPEGAPAGSCWARDTTPAVVESVTEEVLVAPARFADDGTLLQAPVYREETRRAIVQERREITFETLCPEALTVEFVASLQRALAARGHFIGPVSAQIDTRTRRALRAYQMQELGLESATLARETARRLGLVPWERSGTG